MLDTRNSDQQTDRQEPYSAPSVTLPKGGGAIRGIGEKFAVNPVTGTGSMTIPLPLSPGRAGFGPGLALSYDSGSGNGPFGFGWSLSLPSITRKTDKGLPQYRDAEESDVFILSGAEDLVMDMEHEQDSPVAGYTIHRYRPRVEGLFARIERWTRQADGDMHWRSITRGNVLTVYGLDASSRIADPSDPSRVFSWLICETRDDKGNAVQYEYKPEDGTGVNLAHAHERNRGGLDDPRRTANRYIKSIRYGNRKPLLEVGKNRPLFVSADLMDQAGWMFEAVFDYGEHDSDSPTPADNHPWICRQDAFSTYRSGFEVRTYRLCRRVMMFHHFEQEAGIGKDCLVRSTAMTYSSEQDLSSSQNLTYAFMTSVTDSGYKRQPGGYARSSLPPIEFEYSKPIVQDRVEIVDADDLTNLPVGIDGSGYQWIDLHGEGIPGLLAETAGSWYYKRNLSPASEKPLEFAPLECVALKPNLSITAGGKARFMDWTGDGRPDLVMLEGQVAGIYEHDDSEGWHPFRPFAAPLNLDLEDPNVRLLDLDGDGRPDVLITEQDTLVWHPLLAKDQVKDGFGHARRIAQALDEEIGPNLVFADGLQSIYLADMSGDGLTDLVRIRNGSICYWPNLGYGCFGAKVTMDLAPWFDTPEHFDTNRIKMADIDGTGTTDIVYLHSEGVRLYFNQSGNGWSAPHLVHTFPNTEHPIAVMTADLLGNDTACLVWSSPLPADSGRQLRYINLMGSQKPHLLVRVINNMGAETIIRYAPSTKFYLADRQAGKPWLTNLPFPVHVVEQTETRDFISRNRFVSRYSYHHGYFDSEEREFRGFGMVERLDTEAYEDYAAGVLRLEGHQELAPELNQPPVTTRTWYHTGAFLGRDHMFCRYREEYYRKEALLPEPVLPEGLDDQEMRECFRALKGLPLRQETYSYDGSSQEAHPYGVIEYTYEIRRVQPRGNRRHAVFLPVSRETVSQHLEREPNDPRVAHDLYLETDEFGLPRKSCSVIYGRRIKDTALPQEVIRDQRKTYITYSETDYTGDIGIKPSAYRLRVPYESRTYEITGVVPDGVRFSYDELRTKIEAAADIAYEIVAGGAVKEKRLLSQSRTVFLDNDLHPMPIGQWDSLGLTYRSFKLAYTADLANDCYEGEVTSGEFASAGYVHCDGDADWWVPSGTAIYADNAADHFYIPIGVRDPMGVETVAERDSYDLLVESVYVRQAAWHKVTAVNDYRILGPVLVTDLNGSRTAIEVDALGRVVKSAAMGDEDSSDGDTLADPTMRWEYELWNWKLNGKPNFVHAFARERHGTADTRWQESYTYLNGSGGAAMVKAQAHPGKALMANEDGTVTEVDADPRWIGNGRTILNNKGNPVKQYEPYYSVTHEYEEERSLKEIGSTPILFYDALGRNIRTLLPNGTFTKVEFDSWSQRVYDPNDNVKQSDWYAERGSPDPEVEPEPESNPERRAAWLAAKHADTPGAVHYDSLRRPLYVVTDYGGGKKAGVRSETDLSGRFTKLFDPIGREVASGFAGMLGISISGESAEKGRRKSFVNVLGALVKTWDEHGRQFRTEYDELHRPVGVWVQESGQDEVLFTYMVYGDRHPEAVQRKLLGRIHQIFDQAGMVRIPEADFKGNPKRVERVLARAYKSGVDWSLLSGQPDYGALQAAAQTLLESSEVFAAAAEYDALNRPVRAELPDGTVIVPAYNEANFLSSLKAQCRGEGDWIEFLKNQDYNAKGQRQFAHYGNDLVTRYFYDAKSFRLTDLMTRKAGGPVAESMQALRYTYDAIGNLVQIRDNAQQTRYFNNAVVKPENLYEYDAIYQLIKATGREQAGGGNDGIRASADLDFVPQLPHQNDMNAVRTYTEVYEYDLLGNLTQWSHRYKFQPGIGSGWTRQYRYAYEDDAANRTNRLVSTSLPGDPEGGTPSARYEYDDYGNMTRMPHLEAMDWNYLDQLREVDLGGGGKAYYVYGADGQRIRKVIERNGNESLEWIMLGAVQIFRRRRRDTAELRFERWTVHIHDNCGPIAQIDTKTRDDDNRDPANPLHGRLIRYQSFNHLGSVVLETDENGDPISYEEYHPFGTSAYRSSKPGRDLSLKRYRFSGKERDDETGLHYFGARYYASWLGRWTSADPAGFVRGSNLYCYCSNNPVMMVDPNGMEDRQFGLPADANVPEGASAAEIRRRAGRLQRHVYNQGYRWNRDGQDNPAPIYNESEQTWYFGIFDPNHIPANDPLGLLRSESPPGASDASESTGGTGTSEDAQSSDTSSSSTAGTSSTDPGMTPVPDSLRMTAQELARPSSVTGARPRGTLHLWSREGKAEARAAIQRDGSGWMMGDIEGSPTPQHAAAEVEYKALMDAERLRNPGVEPTLSQAEFDRIWGRSSAEVVGRGAFAGHPVEGHGPVSTEFGQPGYVQGAWETPARQVGGALAGGLSFGTGMFTAISGGQDPNPLVAVPSVLAGVGEATSGIIYGSGAILGATEAMAIGTAGSTFFGGAGAMIGFGVASSRAFEQGDTVGGFANLAGAVGGALLIASLFTPVGWVGVAGVALVAFAAGFNVGRWLSR